MVNSYTKLSVVDEESVRESTFALSNGDTAKIQERKSLNGVLN